MVSRCKFVCSYVIAELHQETNYVKHHIQKVCGFFAAMTAFADHLSNQGHQVLHLNLDQTVEFSDLNALISHLTNQYAIETFEYQQPDEYRLSQQLLSLQLDPILLFFVEILNTFY